MALWKQLAEDLVVEEAPSAQNRFVRDRERKRRRSSREYSGRDTNVWMAPLATLVEACGRGDMIFKSASLLPPRSSPPLASTGATMSFTSVERVTSPPIGYARRPNGQLTAEVSHLPRSAPLLAAPGPCTHWKASPRRTLEAVISSGAKLQVREPQLFQLRPTDHLISATEQPQWAP
jgi:hypothetical protein